MAEKTIRRSVAQDLRVAVFAGPTALLEAPGEGAARAERGGPFWMSGGTPKPSENHRKVVVL